MCIFDNCKNRAYYNYETEEKPKYCSEHRKSGMVNFKTLKRKKCFEDGCNIIPSFNYKNEKKPQFCSEHQKE